MCGRTCFVLFALASTLGISCGADSGLYLEGTEEASNKSQRDRCAGASEEEIIYKAWELDSCLQDVVSELVRQAIYGQSVDARISALARLISPLHIRRVTYQRGIMEIIEGALTKGTEEQKSVAFMLLTQAPGFRGSGDYLIPVLLHLLRNDEESEWHPHIAHTLGWIGVRSGGVVPELIRAYYSARERKHDNLQAEAGLALARLRVKDVIAELTRDAKSESPLVRLSAVKGLGLYRTLPADAIEALCVAAKNDPESAVRAEAITSLGSYELGEHDLTIEAILSALEDKEPKVRRATINAAEKLEIANEDVIMKLVEMEIAHERDKPRDFWLLVDLKNALVAAGNEGIPVFRNILWNAEAEEYRKRTLAAEVLSRVSAEGVKVLVETVKEDKGKGFAMQRAIIAMERAHAYADLAEPALIDALKEKKWSYWAVRSLINLTYKSARGYAVIAQVIQDPAYDEHARRSALFAIGPRQAEHPEIEAALRIAAQDKNPFISSRSKELLQQLEHKRRQKDDPVKSGDQWIGDRQQESNGGNHQD